jgi:hypothetical protein
VQLLLVAGGAVVLDQGGLQGQRLVGVPGVVEQQRHPPGGVQVPPGRGEHVAVGVHQAQSGAGLYLAPVAQHLAAAAVPGGGEEGRLGQQAGQARPDLRPRQLPGQFFQLPVVHIPAGEVSGQAEMGGVGWLLVGQIAALDAGGDVLVEEAQQPRAIDQRGLERQPQRRPVGVRQRPAWCAQQVEQLGLGQPAARGPQAGHGVADQSRSVAFVILLAALEDALVQPGDVAGRQLVVDPFVELLVDPEDTQLFQ